MPAFPPITEQFTMKRLLSTLLLIAPLAVLAQQPAANAQSWNLNYQGYGNNGTGVITGPGATTAPTSNNGLVTRFTPTTIANTDAPAAPPNTSATRCTTTATERQRARYGGPLPFWGFLSTLAP
jgi:hypothetical protein